MDSRPPSPDAPPEHLPVWVRAADALTVAVAGLALLVAGSGGFRVHVFGSRVSITSGPRLLAVALVILLVRHAVRRRPPIYMRAWRSMALWRAADGVRAVTPVLARRRRAGVYGVEVEVPGTQQAELASRESASPLLAYRAPVPQMLSS